MFPDLAGLTLVVWISARSWTMIDPVSGRLGANALHATALVGWLGLFGILEGLLGSGVALAAGDCPGCDLGARADPELSEHV